MKLFIKNEIICAVILTHLSAICNSKRDALKLNPPLPTYVYGYAQNK